MRFGDFKLERYFGEWEFSARILLGSSDPESMRLPELLALADADGRRRFEELWLGYTESAGLPALREAVAGRYAACQPGDILVFSAPEEAIFHVAAAVLEPRDHMVGITPAYQSSYEIPRALGAEVTLVPLREDRGWALDLDELAARLTSRTKLIYVNFPHNPTGAMISPAGQRRLAELADSCGAWLFSDEVYRGLEFDPADRLPAAADLYPRAVSLGGLSKAYGLPGVRLGWTACRDAGLNQRLLEAKDFTTICAAAPARCWRSSRCGPRTSSSAAPWPASPATWSWWTGSSPGGPACCAGPGPGPAVSGSRNCGWACRWPSSASGWSPSAVCCWCRPACSSPLVITSGSGSAGPACPPGSPCWGISWTACARPGRARSPGSGLGTAPPRFARSGQGT